MSLYYDRQGRPITLEEWSVRLEKDRRVAETTLPNGIWVSTIWLGLDHSFGSGPPLIFETMVFRSQEPVSSTVTMPTGKIITMPGLSDLECDRYSTEEEALRGHEAMVQKWTEHSDKSKQLLDDAVRRAAEKDEQ